MEQHTNTKDTDMLHCDHQIPQEVPASKSLHQPRSSSVAMHPFHLAHLVPLVIIQHNPQRQPADNRRLYERHDVHVPVQLRARIELRVYIGEEVAANHGRDVFVGEMVESECEGYFVEVQGKRAQM